MMKSFLFRIIGVVACLSWMMACNEEDNDFVGFSIDKTDITVGAEGGSDKVLVQSSTEWVATASEPWLMVSPANGVGPTETSGALISSPHWKIWPTWRISSAMKTWRLSPNARTPW